MTHPSTNIAEYEPLRPEAVEAIAKTGVTYSRHEARMLAREVLALRKEREDRTTKDTCADFKLWP